MEPFPFSEAEWNAVFAASCALVEASAMGDAVLRDSRQVDLLDVIAELRSRHGEHPVLLETEADFSEGRAERSRLYRQATDLAVRHRLPTLSIRLSLARDLLEATQRQQAKDELLACERELPEATEDDRSEWRELLDAAMTGEGV